jgi:hypothetical protein
MEFNKLFFSVAFVVVAGASPALAAQLTPTLQGNPQSGCGVHVWQSKRFDSSNGNAVGGIVGALIQGAVDAGAPPKLVTEQMAQNLEDQDLAALVKNIDWSRYLGPRQVAVTMESTVDEKTMRAMERSQARNSSSTSDCQIELYIGKQTFQGGMKTWLFSNLGVRVFDGGKYHLSSSMEYTHVKSFPAKSSEQYPAAIEGIRDGFSRNLAKLLDKSFPGRAQ